MGSRWEVTEVRVVIQADEDADLSWLEQSDAEMGEGFEAYSAKRMTAYVNGEWHMTGIYAQATLRHRTGVQDGWDGTTRVRTGGIWGVESDSDESYVRELADEQLAELRTMLTDLGLTFDDDDVEGRP